jgi:hypothetical protein
MSRGQIGHMNILNTQYCLTDFKFCTSWKVDDHYWFWGSTVKGSNWTSILTTQYLENPFLDRLQTLWTSTSWKVEDHYWFWSSKVKGSNWAYEYTDYSISWEPFVWQISNLVYYYIMKSRWPWLILRSKVKVQTGHMNILTTQYLENPLLDRHQTLYTSTPFDFEVITARCLIFINFEFK